MNRNLDQIIQANKLESQTYLINTPERESLRNSIILNMLHKGSFSNEDLDYSGEVIKSKQLDIVIGLPGSGKSSSVANPLSQKFKSLIIDADNAKEMLPEYNNGLGSDIVHKESKEIALRVINIAIDRNINIVYSIVGKSINSITNIADYAKTKGYNVNLHLVEIEPSRAAVRAMERFATTGRYVDVNYIINDVGYKPRENYELLKNHVSFNRYIRYDNNVPFGDKPIEIENISKGIIGQIKSITTKNSEHFSNLKAKDNERSLRWLSHNWSATLKHKIW